MGSIARKDLKPPSICEYMSKPSPQPIAQNRVFKSERPGPPLMDQINLIRYENDWIKFLLSSKLIKMT